MVVLVVLFVCLFVCFCLFVLFVFVVCLPRRGPAGARVWGIPRRGGESPTWGEIPRRPRKPETKQPMSPGRVLRRPCETPAEVLRESWESRFELVFSSRFWCRFLARRGAANGPAATQKCGLPWTQATPTAGGIRKGGPRSAPREKESKTEGEKAAAYNGTIVCRRFFAFLHTFFHI